MLPFPIGVTDVSSVNYDQEAVAGIVRSMQRLGHAIQYDQNGKQFRVTHFLTCRACGERKQDAE